MKIEATQDIMSLNNQAAAENRMLFSQNNVWVVNILGSPGAGKTTLLEKALALLPSQLCAAVIEGDLATAKDAARIADLGVPVVQINTDGGCHLDASMISRVLPAFDLTNIDLLLIENVGNLVCPSSFDLGENERWVVLSTSEGADKPSKYPTTFLTADAVVLNKVDLLPYVDFDLKMAKEDIFAIRPSTDIYAVSCRAENDPGLAQVVERLTRAAGSVK